MQTYLLLKSVIVASGVIGALGYFGIRIRHLIRLIRAVQGQTDFGWDRIGERIKILFTDVLGQSNVRRKPLIGLCHTLIFYGFLAVQPHSLVLMIQGIFPAFDPGHWAPGFYSLYLFIADILAALVLVGLVYALYRRLIVRPKYLTLGTDAILIILFTSVIVISFHFINAFLTLKQAVPGDLNYAVIFPVSNHLVHLFALHDLSLQGAVMGYEITYWIHVGTILGFLIYIPGSKHLHLLAAIPNVFLKPLQREKAVIKTDLEDEAAETFGLGKVSELNWKNVLNLYACTECGRCEEQCPASNTEKPLSPRKIIHDLKIDLFNQSDAVLAQKDGDIKTIIREGSPITGEVIWSCTTCRACEDTCPVNIEHLDFIIEIRKQQVLMEAKFPTEMQETFNNLENQFNPWGFTNDNRADWCQGMDVPLMTDKPTADILYFVGCAGAFDDRGKKIAQAMARVLQYLGVDFAILGPEESCNGDVARRAGNEYLAQMLIQKNVEVMNHYKPQKILTSCPHCYNIIKNEFPQFGADYPVLHHTEFLLTLQKEGRLSFENDASVKRTFHDSCYLGRWNGIYNAPRDLLRFRGGEKGFIEMKRNQSKGFCCGAGGGRMFMEESLGKRINIERVGEIIATNADTVAAACPFCITMLRDGLLEKDSTIEVKDIIEIIDERLNPNYSLPSSRKR